jgi:hypothetical protein
MTYSITRLAAAVTARVCPAAAAEAAGILANIEAATAAPGAFKS